MKSNKFIKSRLSLLMFLQFFNSGITCPIMSSYLMYNLNFSGKLSGLILSVAGITTILSSILGTFLADNILKVNRLLSLCYLMAAINMTIFIHQTRFELVLVLYLLYTLSIGCTSGCVNTIVFNNEKNAKKNFGGIQMWGSIGWISAGWLFSIVWLRNVERAVAITRLSDALRVSVVIYMLLFLYTFSLPNKKTKPKEKISILPKEALRVLSKPKNILVCILLFIIFTSFQYYIFGIGPFLRQSLYRESVILPLMSVAQFSEAICLGFLGYLIVNKDYIFTMNIGLIFNLLRFVALFLGSSLPLILSALICHGLASAYFFTTACIYLDSQCENSYVRAGVQQIACILSYGMGASFGNLCAGRTITMFESKLSEAVNYRVFWCIPTIVGVLMLILYTNFKKQVKAEYKQITSNDLCL